MSLVESVVATLTVEEVEEAGVAAMAVAAAMVARSCG
jgi:hypothetical protein